MLHVVCPLNVLPLSLRSWMQRLWLEFKEAGLISQPFTTYLRQGKKGRITCFGVKPEKSCSWGKMDISLSEHGRQLKWAKINMLSPAPHSFVRSFCLPLEALEGNMRLSFSHSQDGILTKIHLLSCCKPWMNAPRASVPPQEAADAGWQQFCSQGRVTVGWEEPQRHGWEGG